MKPELFTQNLIFIRLNVLQISQTELSEYLNYSQSAITKWESRGRKSVSDNEATRIFRRLQHHPNWSAHVDLGDFLREDLNTIYTIDEEGNVAPTHRVAMLVSAPGPTETIESLIPSLNQNLRRLLDDHIFLALANPTLDELKFLNRLQYDSHILESYIAFDRSFYLGALIALRLSKLNNNNV